MTKTTAVRVSFHIQSTGIPSGGFYDPDQGIYGYPGVEWPRELMDLAALLEKNVYEYDENGHPHDIAHRIGDQIRLLVSPCLTLNPAHCFALNGTKPTTGNNQWDPGGAHPAFLVGYRRSTDPESTFHPLELDSGGSTGAKQVVKFWMLCRLLSVS